MVRRGAKLLHAFAECCVPRVTLMTRKAYGGAYIAMNSRALGATRVFAWPDAEVAVMGAVAAVRILHRRTLAGVPPERRHELETELAAEHEKESGGLARALDLGVVDEVIDPARTRQAIATAIAEAFPLAGRTATSRSERRDFTPAPRGPPAARCLSHSPGGPAPRPARFTVRPGSSP